MINSAINDLNRALRVINGIPDKIKSDKRNTISMLNDILEDFRDKFKDNQDALKNITSLKIDILSKVEDLCENILSDVEENVRIIEE